MEQPSKSLPCEFGRRAEAVARDVHAAKLEKRLPVSRSDRRGPNLDGDGGPRRHDAVRQIQVGGNGRVRIRARRRARQYDARAIERRARAFHEHRQAADAVVENRARRSRRRGRVERPAIHERRIPAGRKGERYENR
jgi:hypothetical protein